MTARHHRLAAGLAALTVASLGASRSARAYVREVNEQEVQVYWPQSCEPVTIYPNGYSGLTSDQIAKSIAAAAAAWSPAAVTCPDGSDGGTGAGHPYFEVLPSLSSGGPVPAPGAENFADGRNWIVFETTTWSEDPEAIAFTVRHMSTDGQILDAHMVINGTNLDLVMWGNLDPGATTIVHGIPLTDLQTAITHEFGHFLGLAHTCFNPDLDPLPVPDDDQGQPIPTCTMPGDPPPDTTAGRAVMWYQVASQSTAKRVLSPDDMRGICAIYPPASDPHSCSLNLPDDGCGCAATGGRLSAATLALAVMMLALAAARARRWRLRSDRDRPASR